jgi:hypothetical protein
MRLFIAEPPCLWCWLSEFHDLACKRFELGELLVKGKHDAPYFAVPLLSATPFSGESGL